MQEEREVYTEDGIPSESEDEDETDESVPQDVADSSDRKENAELETTEEREDERECPRAARAASELAAADDVEKLVAVAVSSGASGMRCSYCR